MSSKTRIKQQKENKVYSQNKVQNTRDNYIAFSWQYLTKNKKYTFDYFANNMRNEMDARRALSSFLIYLSSLKVRDILSRKKDDKGGFERIDTNSLSFSPSNNYFGDDTEVTVFRFCNQKYRLIGFLRSSILYIIGYDFDYSAYNHGS